MILPKRGGILVTVADKPPEYTVLDIQRAICAKSFIDFLEHVYIIDPPPYGRGVIKFQLWPHLVDLIHILGTDRLICILKARQVGISWLLAAYALWTAMYQEGAVVLLFSQGEDEAKVLLGKCKTIHGLLPEHLRGDLGADSTVLLTFPDARSKIAAYPSTEKAGRSETGTLVIQDEADFHEQLDANYTAVKPTIDTNGGQLIQVSTVNKRRMVTLFKQIFRGAREGVNGFKGVFLGWRARPGRDEKWYERTKAAAPTTDDMSPELYMEQEYPASEAEALAPSRVLAAFDADALADMEKDIREPIETRGPVSIFQKAIVGRKYVGFSDASHGVGSDDGVTAVMEVGGKVVADVQGNNLSPEEQAELSVNLLREYGAGTDPLWAIEDNDWGILLIRKAQELGYQNLYHRSVSPPNTVLPPNASMTGRPQVKRVGWHTDERNRHLLWGEVMEAVRVRAIVVYSRRGWSQFTSVIRNPDKGGRIEAMSGTHDDYPFAVGGAWQMQKEALTGATVTPIRSFRPTR
jgi:hypothetical protein